MKNKMQCIVGTTLSKFMETNEDGFLQLKEGVTPNQKITIGNIKTTIKRWVYFLEHGKFPSSRVRTSAVNERIIDPRFLYTTEEMQP